MNVLYVVGNGFDLSLNLPTSYEQYYEFISDSRNAREVGTPNAKVSGLIKSILNDKDNWADLELELGKYVANITTKEELEDIHSFLVHSLSRYLINVEGNYDCDNSQSSKIFNDMLYPEEYLLTTDKHKIESFRKVWTASSASWSLNILTLNYTTIFEKIVNFTRAKINCGKYNDRNTLYLKGINHIHGYKDRELALGLNDISQFLNSDFASDEDIQDVFIKSQYNADCKTGHEVQCINLIKDANLICIFGVSFGDTDKRWWQFIGEQLRKTTTRLIIFHYNKYFTPDPLYPKIRSREERRVLDLFLHHLKLSDSEKKDVKSRIFVSINSDMFTVDNSKFTYNDDWCYRPVPQNEIEQILIDIIKESEGASKSEIINSISYDKILIIEGIKALLNNGQIEFRGTRQSGKYYIANGA